MTPSFAVLTLAAACLAAPPCLAALSPEDSDALYEQALQSIAEGRKRDASETLAQVIEAAPQHAGAWLDLALIQCALGQQAEAERLFGVIEARFAPPEGIRELIAKARAQGCNSSKTQQHLALSLGRGFDRNVNQGTNNAQYTIVREGVPVDVTLSPDFLPKADQYTVLAADYVRDLTRNGSVGFVQLQGRHNDRLSSYDSASLFFGLESPWRRGRWTLRTAALAGYTTLGGRLFQRHVQLQGKLATPLSSKLNVQLSGSYGHADYVTLSSFDARTADLKAQLSYRSERFSALVSHGPTYDHALTDRPGGDKRGWASTAQLRAPLGAGSTGELTYLRQSWDNQERYAPGVIDAVRKQTTHIARASITVPLARQHNLLIEARRVWNRENISLFQYNNRQLQVSWQWQGP
jgi:hypothetical protein